MKSYSEKEIRFHILAVRESTRKVLEE